MITNEELNKYRDKLVASSSPAVYDDKERPCYQFYMVGTREEIEATRRKIMELDVD